MHVLIWSLNCLLSRLRGILGSVKSKWVIKELRGQKGCWKNLKITNQNSKLQIKFKLKLIRFSVVIVKLLFKLRLILKLISL